MTARWMITITALLAACGASPAAETVNGSDSTSPDQGPSTETTTPLSTSGSPSTGAGTTTATEPPVLYYELVASGLPVPVLVTARPGADLAYVATKDGRVWELGPVGIGETPVLDISDRVRDSGEQGLLGLALHPTDQSRVFVHYTGLGGDTVLSEFNMDAQIIDPDSERELLRLGQPASNHNGGMIQFDASGTLYLGLGDGGGANDRYGNGQNQSTLLAGLVAVDVDTGAAVKELSGLRNPWRFWIDGDSVVIGDVGQNTYEEIDVVPSGSIANLGWPIMEGLHCFAGQSSCDKEGLTLPVVEVRHGDGGTCSITGGVVYRGAAIPEMVGRYFFSDYCGGWLRSFDLDDPMSVTDHTEQVGIAGSVVSFGVDGAREMYVLTADSVLLVRVRR